MSSKSIYLLIDGVHGSGTDARYPDGIELESYGMEDASTRDFVTGIRFTRKHDATSPKLFQLAGAATPLGKVSLVFVDNSAGDDNPSREILRIDLGDAYLADVHTSAGKEAASDQGTLNFASFEISYGHVAKGTLDAADQNLLLEWKTKSQKKKK